MNLFCLPFAGGSKYSFQVLKPHTRLNVFALDLPGRGTRLNEPLLLSVEEMANDFVDQIKDLLFRDYAILGHSMGALLGYLCIKEIISRGLPKPEHFFALGRKAPSKGYEDEVYYNLPKDEFFQKLVELEGMPDGFFDDPALVAFFEPMLRADFQAIETYQYKRTEPFDVPICVITGTREKITPEEAAAWQEETIHPVELISIEGNHFFLLDRPGEVMSFVEKRYPPQLKKW